MASCLLMTEGHFPPSQVKLQAGKAPLAKKTEIWPNLIGTRVSAALSSRDAGDCHANLGDLTCTHVADTGTLGWTLIECGKWQSQGKL